MDGKRRALPVNQERPRWTAPKLVIPVRTRGEEAVLLAWTHDNGAGPTGKPLQVRLHPL